MKILFLLLMSFSAFASIKINAKIMNAVSMSTSVKSSVVNLNSLKGYSIQAVISSPSAPIGKIYLEVSNDPTATDSPSEVVNWSQLADTVIDVADVTTDADVLWNISEAQYKWVRVGYDRTSGSATLNATIVGKE